MWPVAICIRISAGCGPGFGEFAAGAAVDTGLPPEMFFQEMLAQSWGQQLEQA